MGDIDPNHHFMNHLWVDAINEAGCHPITPSIFVAKIGHMVINNNNLDIFGQGSERMLGGDGGDSSFGIFGGGCYWHLLAIGVTVRDRKVTYLQKGR